MLLSSSHVKKDVYKADLSSMVSSAYEEGSYIPTRPAAPLPVAFYGVIVSLMPVKLLLSGWPLRFQL